MKKEKSKLQCKSWKSYVSLCIIAEFKTPASAKVLLLSSNSLLGKVVNKLNLLFVYSGRALIKFVKETNTNNVRSF